MGRRLLSAAGARSLVACSTIAALALADAAPQRTGDADAPTHAVVFVLQRNNRLSVFDAQSLDLIGSFVTGPMGDGLSVRPDGRVVYLLQAVTPALQMRGSSYPGCCSLQALDLETRRMCFVSEPANLTTLPHRASVSVPPALSALRRPDGSSFRPTVVAVGDLLVAYERTGAGLIMSPDRDRQPPVGAFLVDPKTGTVVRHILPDVFFRDLIASHDGRFLYGIEDWPRGDPVRFMRIDAGTGAVTAERILHPARGSGGLVEEWALAYADVPAAFVPQGEVRVNPCR